MAATSTAPLVTIIGGSGFVGRYVAQRMARRGWRVRVAVRRPNEANFVRPYGDVGQVEPIQANIRDEASTRRAIEGATAVINCVGVLTDTGRQSFAAVHVDGAGRIARLAADCGVAHLVHVSALGADEASDSASARSKAAGEAAVLAAFPGAAILRPSVLFGHEDSFFNRFAGMAKISPVIPLVGADTLFQPVHVDDVAEAACLCATGAAAGGVYELGGPKTYSFRDLMKLMLAETRRRRLLLALPFFAARIMAWGLDLAGAITGMFGLPNEILTKDQVRQLAHDNVVSAGAQGFAELGLKPKTVESVVGEYLYAYRPYGQYDAITESAANLKA